MKKAFFYLTLVLLSVQTFGQTSLVTSNCGSTVSNPDTYIYCNLVSSAQEYKFEVRESGSLIQEVVSADNKIQLSEFSGIYGRTYSITVAAKVGGVLSSYGTACDVSIAFPTTSLVSNNCGSKIQDASQYLYCFSHASAQGYRFEVTPAGGTASVYTSTTNKFRLTDALTPQPGVTYTVKAAGLYGGKYAPYGTACSVTLAFPTTSLVASDCGATVTGAQYLYCTTVSNAQAYKFEITPQGGTATTKEFTTNKFRLSDIVTVGNFTTYTVKVAAKINGVVGPYGTACNVTTTGFVTRLVDANCNKNITGGDQLLYCLKDTSAEGYMFEVTPAGGTAVTHETTTNSFKLSDALSEVKGSTTYTIRARAKFSGNYAPYGTACNVITPGTTALVSTQCNINITSIETILYATILQDVTDYSFKVTEGTTLVGTYETTTNKFKLADINGKFGRKYSVSVAVKRTGSTTFGDYGNVCTVTTPSLPTTSMVPNDCDVTLTNKDKTLYCLLASGALAYKFEITPEGGTSVYHEVNTNKFKLADVLTPQSETTYTIRVLGKFPNGYGDYGAACTVKTPPITAPDFYLHSNGVTCMCPNAKVGDKGYVNGKTYTKRIKILITPANASSTCTSGITDLSALFQNQSTFNEDISTWDVSQVTTMASLFEGASAFNQDVSNWDVSNVTSMYAMFYNNFNFNQNLSQWDVSKVTNMDAMFTGTFKFDQDLSNWDVSNVTSMWAMFDSSKFNHNISSWDVSKVTRMAYMFNGAIAFNQPIGNWNVSNVTTMVKMFADNSTFNQDISKWDVSTVTDMSYLFYNNSVFNKPLNTWCVSHIPTKPENFTYSSALTIQNEPKWGKSCEETTQLVSTQCNATIATPATVVYCSVLSDVVGYKFQLTQGSTLIGEFETNTNKFKLSDANGTYGNTYAVKVAVKRANTGFGIYGAPCTVTVQAGPTFALLASSSNITVRDSDHILYCNKDLAAEGYRFEITPSGGTPKIHETTSNKFKLSDVYATVPHSTDFSVRVAAKYVGNYGAWGGAKTVKSPPVSRIVDTQCGKKVNDINAIVYCYKHNDVTNYKFEVSEKGKVIGTYETTTNKFKLADVNGINHNKYAIRVAIKRTGNTSYGDYGPVCTVYTGDLFYAHTNGVTCLCPNADVGDSWDFKGKTFTKRSKAQITSANASTTCTSGITDMSTLIVTNQFDSSFNGDISHWDVSNVTNMETMFWYASSFNQDLKYWDVSKVTNMRGMFSRTNVFNGDISTWDVSSVTNMIAMFSEAWAFNQDISKWDTSNVTNMATMFNVASTFNQDISKWNVGKVTNMSNMFSLAWAFNQDISKWNVSNVTDMESMFDDARVFNADISDWNVSKVTKMRSMFHKAAAFDQEINIWCVNQITSLPADFSKDSGLTSGHIPHWGAECKTKSMLVANQCGINVTPSTIIYCLRYTDVTNYRFELSKGGTVVGTYDTDVNKFKLTDAKGTFGNTYTIRLALKRTGETSFDNYGKSCTVTTPAAPTTSLVTNNCGITVTGGDQTLYCNKDLSAEGYKFEVTPEGGTAITYESTSNKFKLSDALTTVNASVTFNVRVAGKFGGEYASYGKSCKVTTPAVTRLVDNQCNATIATPQTVVYSYKLTDATNYRFELSEGNKVVGTFDTNINKFRLSDANGTYAKTYSIRVAVKRSGSSVYGDFGPGCTATTPAMPTTSLVTNSCGITVSGGDEILYCYKNLSAEGYKFEVTPAGGTSTVYETTENKFKLSDVYTTVPNNMTYSVKVAGKYGGTYAPYGSACSIKTPELTKLVDTQCGSSVTSAQALVYCYIKSNVTNYKFEVSHKGSVIGTYETDTNKFKLADAGGVDAKLYSVRVALKYTGSSVYREYGPTCKIASSKFYLHDNDVTCMCPDAAVGDSGIVNGVTYTKRSKDQITETNASTTCTSGITDMKELFYQDKFAYLPYKNYFNADISSWDTSNVTTMERMLGYCHKFNQDISNWDVSKVTNMSGMFTKAEEFNQRIGSWDVSQVITMHQMFIKASSFNQSISNWNVRSVKSLNAMFFQATSFNQPLGNWDVSKVVDMSLMFYKASAFNQNIGNWDVGNVTDMKNMFYECVNYNQPLDSWNVSKVVNMSNMFTGASSFNEPIGNWNVSKVLNMSYMFDGASAFNKRIDNWDVGKVISMENMFNGASSFNQPLMSWCVSHISSEPSGFAFNSGLSSSNKPNWGAPCMVKNPNFYLHANGVTCMCPDAAIGEVGGVNGVNYTKRTKDQITEENAATSCTSGITDMSNMFANAKSFDQDISSWDVSKVTSMSSMFSGASAFNQPIGKWNVSNVTDMGSMFAGASAFNQPIGDWDVSNVYFIGYMFYLASSFNQPIGNWDVSSVSHMLLMFDSAISFNQPIGNWNTSKVTNMSSMFSRTSAFNQPIGNWDVSKVDDLSSMFDRANSFNQDISTWCVSQISTEPYAFAPDSPLSSSHMPLWGQACSSSRPSVNVSDEVVEVRAYPNPFTYVFGISFASESEENVSIVVYDMAGRVVEQSIIPANEVSSQVYGQNLGTGIYNVVLTQGENTHKLRVIKN